MLLVLSIILVGCDDSPSSCTTPAPTRSTMEQGARFCIGNINVKSYTTGEHGSFKVVCENGNSAEVIVKLGTE